MSGDRSGAGSDHMREVELDLELTRRELKWIRVEQEHMSEALQRVRRQRAKLREQSEALASALATELSASYWRNQPSSPGLLRRRNPDTETALVRELEDCPLFDAGWYLRQHQQAILEQGLTPALHHLRLANERRLDPSEGFNTRRYLARHPEAADSALPAVLHAQRHGHLEDGRVVVDATED